MITNTRHCNCSVKQNCPLNGKCLAPCIVYKAKVNTNSDKHTYYELCERKVQSMIQQPHEIIQVAKVWKRNWIVKVFVETKRVQRSSKEFTLSWEIAVHAYKCETRRCDLCLSEKVCIIRAEPNGLLNMFAADYELTRSKNVLTFSVCSAPHRQNHKKCH